ncbi:unnamed protein product [Penicillium olsonii]|uniref:RanBD1 domain-containing protein n=1 Tax=Penicillium olsonii TaxID=99116 RepID=A0A9W4HLJ7_PENOL|nr:unnamed protein product [Penicillium olsonii]CAG8079939.1 unnamed protein product [Penicillium olsonii]
MASAREQSPSVAAQSPPSDNDGGERPVRQQLQNTNIDAVNGSAHINRKRSLEDADAAADEHPTKRSREGTPESTSQLTSGEKSAAPGVQSTNNRDSVSDYHSDSEFSSDLPETPVEFGAQSPVLQHSSGEESFNPPGQQFCAPVSTKVTLPLDFDLTLTCCGTKTTQHFSVPLEVQVDIPQGSLISAVALPTTLPAGPKSHISISSDSTPSPEAPSSPPPRTYWYRGYRVRDPYPERDPDVERDPYPVRDPDVGRPVLLSPFRPRRDPDVERPALLPSLCPRRDPAPGCLTLPTLYPHARSYPRASDYFDPDYPLPSIEEKGYANARLDLLQPHDSERGSQLTDDSDSQNDEPSETTEGEGPEEESPKESPKEELPKEELPKEELPKEQKSNDQAFTASAFGKASAGSPFALNTANPSASPFALNSTASSSSFAAKPAAPVPSSFANSAFGSASTASPFTMSGSSSFGFGGLGSGTSFSSQSPFGNQLGGAPGKITSFASPNLPSSFGDSKNKEFGAPKADKDESDNESEGEQNDTFVAEKTDERFHEKTGMTPMDPPGLAASKIYSSSKVETGEENETTKFSAKGKLYYFDKAWKERGSGTFKINTKIESDGALSGRMIMRADGALRVTLNSAMFHDMNYGEKDGSRPTTKDIFLASNEDGKVGALLLRLGNQDQASELYDVIEEVLAELPKTAK